MNKEEVKIKFTQVRQCEVCGEWSNDGSNDWKYTCTHTPEEYQDALDQLVFKLDKPMLDFIAKRENCQLYKIAEREK